MACINNVLTVETLNGKGENIMKNPFNKKHEEKPIMRKKVQRVIEYKKSTPKLHCSSLLAEVVAEKSNKLSFYYREGEKIMKKVVIMMVTVVLICVALTGCSNAFKEDEIPATVTLTTSSGDATVWKSVNGAGMTQSGKERAIHYKSNIVLKDGETATVTFKCDACGDEQKYEVTEAWAEVLSCKCPEEIDENGNAKEYVAISISFEQ